MKDLRNPNVPMTHDGYLKMYQLYRPRLSNYDCILIDEAQDLTPGVSPSHSQFGEPRRVNCRFVYILKWFHLCKMNNDIKIWQLVLTNWVWFMLR